tara:strand:+ start:1658 stop:1828 length:171 start_codon:yes stop_codon:yes gene_type:complete
MNIDDTRDLAIRIVDSLVEEKLVKNCTDTDDDTEFEFQDTIHDQLNKFFNLKTNKI